MKRKFVIIALLFFINVLSVEKLQAQEKGVPVVIKGTVSDLFTGKYGSVTMLFEDSSGKKFKIAPDVTNGHYQQVLNSGETYTVTFLNYDVFRETFPIKIDYSDKYVEIEKDFKIRRLTAGLTLFETDIFAPGSAEFTPAGSELLYSIIRSTTFLRGSELELAISAGGKSELLARRQSAVSTFAGFDKIKSRIRITSAENKNDFKVIVTSIKDPLK